MILGLNHFRPYLYGQKFVLRTDHVLLTWLLNFKEPGELARWLEVLHEYNFEVRHCAGWLHSNANALSRQPCTGSCRHCHWVEERSLHLVRAAHLLEDGIKEMESLRSSTAPAAPPSRLSPCQGSCLDEVWATTTMGRGTEWISRDLSVTHTQKALRADTSVGSWDLQNGTLRHFQDPSLASGAVLLARMPIGYREVYPPL